MALGVKSFPTSLDDVISLLPARDTAATQLTAALASGATSMTVADTSRFPAAGVLTFKGEHIGYTGKTATSFTGLSRALFSADGGAAAQTGAIGDPVRLAVTARHHNVLVEALIAVQTKLGFNASTPTTVGNVLTVVAAGQTQWTAPTGLPTGGMCAWPIVSIPSDCLECNGQLVSRTTYANLFATIGTAFGAGDGSNFGVPDMRGRAFFGYLAGSPDFGTMGATGGLADVTLTSAQSGLVGHTHADTFATGTDTPDHTHTEYYPNRSGSVLGAGGRNDINPVAQQTGGASARHTHAITGSVTAVASADASASHENLPPYFTGKWIIKT